MTAASWRPVRYMIIRVILRPFPLFDAFSGSGCLRAIRWLPGRPGDAKRDLRGGKRPFLPLGGWGAPFVGSRDENQIRSRLARVKKAAYQPPQWVLEMPFLATG